MTSFSELVRHFFGRFFDKESLSPQGETETNLIQILSLLAVPGLFIAFWILPRAPITGWPLIAERYFFVSYPMIMMGFAMVFEWDALFPDRRDYLILTPLPIRLSAIFGAKLAALCIFLALFAVDVNIFGILLFPGISGAPDYRNALLAHVVAVLAGTLFMALAAAAIQGILIAFLSDKMFRRVSSALQALLMGLLVMTLFLHPFIVSHLRSLVERSSPALAWFPPFWFLGLYEWIYPAGPTPVALGDLSLRAVQALAIAAATFLFTYVAGYRRHSRRAADTVETNPAGPGRLMKAASALLDRTVLTHPLQRAAFHFISQTIARSLKHRLFLATYGGFGAAIAASSLGSGRSGLLPLPLTLSFFLVSGLRAAFNFPSELRANWVFQVTDREDRTECLAATRKWIVICGILPLFALVAPVEFAAFPWTTALFHLAFGITLSVVLMQIMFFTFRKVPFTCSYFPGKVNLVWLSVLYLYGFTTYSYTMSGLEGWLAEAPLRAVVFFGLAVVACRTLARWREREVGIMLSLDFEDTPDPVVRTLDLS
ncbi:MAG: hypothetical protein ACM336_20715 [Acidobacteriota bacterium]